MNMDFKVHISFLISQLLLASLVSANSTLTGSICERLYKEAPSADKHYNMSIVGDPELFLPGELYIISLSGIDSGQGPTPFVGFTIWIQLDSTDEKKNTNTSLGTFQTYDAQTVINQQCKPSVTNATGHPKTEIQVIWTAPSLAPPSCVRVWSRVNTSVLSRQFCVAPTGSSFAKLPPIVQPCCACDEAKYEVKFEGLWSRHTHPRFFPESKAYFGPVLGASHTAHYRVWQEGRVASPGLARLAYDASTTALEKELKAESEHIRTIIKARSIASQQVRASGSVASSFAVFRVDAKHHLVSLASKLAPSPDWIVGVSALELCNSNCTWTTSATIPLYPYDVGTDDGITYTSSRVRSRPPSSVRGLTPEWPPDPRSPFYNRGVGTGDMRPFARLTLTRLRLYERSCDSAEAVEVVSGSPGVLGGGGAGGGCAVGGWGAWGACSVSCGRGARLRQRDYLAPHTALHDHCRATLTQREACYGPRRHCRAPSEYEPDGAESSGPCAVSPWSGWSPCEGCGVRARTRHYVRARAHKHCHTGYRATAILSQAMPCENGPCTGPNGEPLNSSNYDWFFVNKPVGNCSVSSWSTWSGCSSGCGRGRSIRTRLLLTKSAELQTALTNTLMRTWTQRFAELQGIEIPQDNTTIKDREIEEKVQKQIEQCQFTMTVQESLCDGNGKNCSGADVSKESCNLPPSVGYCRSYEERWFYDSSSGVCEPFGFTGCGGNNNNFKTRELCLSVCGGNSSNPTKIPKTVTPSSKKNDLLIQNDAPGLSVEVLDCLTSPWEGWGECFGDCNYAIKLNYKYVLRPPSKFGKPCPVLMKRRTCKPHHCWKLITNITHIHEEEYVDG